MIAKPADHRVVERLEREVLDDDEPLRDDHLARASDGVLEVIDVMQRSGEDDRVNGSGSELRPSGFTCVDTAISCARYGLGICVYRNDLVAAVSEQLRNMSVTCADLENATIRVTEPLQKALISVSNLGGGTLFLPSGFYRIDGNLTIPSGVTLRGDWQRPQIGSPVQGTILQAYAERGDENGTPFIFS